MILFITPSAKRVLLNVVKANGIGNLVATTVRG